MADTATTDSVVPGSATPGAAARFGQSPAMDAWLLHFMTENNLEYLLNPLINSSPEQLRFMCVLDEDEIFVPCSDELFAILRRPALTRDLQEMYNISWRVLIRLVRNHIHDPYTAKKIISFCRHRFQLARSSHILIPSRLMKRMGTIFLTQSGLEDPYIERKKLFNQRADAFIRSPDLDDIVNTCPSPIQKCERLSTMRWELDMLELKRLLALSTWHGIWRSGDTLPGKGTLRNVLNRACSRFDDIAMVFGPGMEPKKILYIPNSSGGILFDLLIIRLLLRQGHQVILALKDSFFFQTPTIWDSERDPILGKALAGVQFIDNPGISKNELIKALRLHRFVIISDGTSERLNLYRTSVTFARAWKECDVVIAKEDPNSRRLIKTRHQFTRDILCFQRSLDGRFELHYKPKPSHVRKFTESDLVAMADAIIQSMREAKAQGNNCMFYSAVVGSIPGQTNTAIAILDSFVEYLRSRLAGTFIINPAEHFVPGMDGDDLMFMWERVQRSGLLDVWRFQTVADIEKAFELMGQTVPPAWAGKDSTFSTGCTKEMKIALETQHIHPELQIIGPSPEKFFRRRDYGVGKYYDSGL